ncbi:inorganic phosphate transporter [Allomuricauda sp. F6463D]|uniref:inorganic phosphate transporter n=1 Tax=Allomuricauda sp. F6463D TaxID=2926409 RepID=UPI001FF4D741|nr:inorganic phosphate transporter [Muricauda sp. F6463D]MCK0161042.1 inorganic phosphate transporter [Muricauda sp. F6463D]
MDNIYFLILVALGILAIADLVVGVSNDAVNFLNSAIGSKAISFKTIMIVASVGIACGAIFSSGLMEVARKGIFNPGEFYFDEIMFIFMAVMITDILLLDFFNTLGMPTSTTVSIVFNLLGAAVAMAILKIANVNGSFSDVVNYINTDKAIEIIIGILSSVIIAFTIGAFVQWVSRLLLSYQYQKKAKWVGAVFAGVALSAISYFILLKGIKGTPIANQTYDFIGKITITEFLETEVYKVAALNFAFWALISYLLIEFAKINIYKVIIGVGTFALALAFAGNDLVNFIGVPIAAWQSYQAWAGSGIAASEFSMEILASQVETPTLLLFLSGMIMVVTLWLSKKARYVAETEINLSREGEAKEKFQPNFLSRGLVRFSIALSTWVSSAVPTPLQRKVDKRFEKPTLNLTQDKVLQLPAFDMIRASVNLMVAGILISIATSYKLPLSTTYVTFMVAMGTSLADRAWGAESAVYRVAGVLNVIAGWFSTAIIAFLASGVILSLISFGKGAAIAILLFAAVLLLVRNYISYNKKSKEIKVEDRLRKAESSSIQGVIEETATNIANVVKRSSKIYSNSINGLAKQALDSLKKNKKQGKKLALEIEDLREHTFYFIKNLEEAHIGASNFYINIMGYLTDMSQSLEYIGKVSHNHVHNNHKKLKYNQIKELKEIDLKLEEIFNSTEKAFEEKSFEQIGAILDSKQELYDLVSQKIDLQVSRTRTEESSPKNTTLYFSLLLETRDLITAMMNLLEQYYREHDSSVEPATIDIK